ncbi:DegT/DnrJ/EryC1/StrS family aminotransferase [Couchioplanes azureus]|uniref:DegT/DnrJ/EryC1/StrS family aminotransferase n=1 Tax=Couchioplanes caeruleus TaxID=56438 RepID=UPI00166F70A4|nr:DegT/DnrJ/EryC1/StrS family aminotransferase [Couchioplanes caeruleus]GGQ76282.1 UDP-4-amino-4,6-dideoxy-N-acetyl-beta-L-altrosamine transaminase [Couchioplanes caeruleus subsp. azureus]
MNGDFVVPFARRGSIVGAEEIAALAALVDSDAPLSAGGLRERFESRFARHVGSRHALSVTSGTVALELAIELLELRPGDEVVATPQTFQATLQPLLDRDVTVRFCDVDPESLNLDADVLETLITPRTRAILLVHYGGWAADMDRIMAIARRHGVLVLEDSAHALGSTYHGSRPGALADISCFSFHATKNITTLGEGGMITTDRDDWAERLDRRRNNEVDGIYLPADEQEPFLLPWMKFSADVYRQACVGVRRAGTNATLAEAAAGVGLTQLDRLETLVARRRRIAGRLDEVLDRHPHVRRQRPPAGVGHAYHLYTFFAGGGSQARDELVRTLHRQGVEVQLRYFPQHLTPEWRWRGHGPGECPTAERLWFTEHMNLPCHPGLTDTQVDHLVHTLDRALAEVPDRTRTVRGGPAVRTLPA